MRSTNRHSFIRSLKRKGFKEEIVIKIGWHDLVTSTTLESNKSQGAIQLILKTSVLLGGSMEVSGQKHTSRGRVPDMDVSGCKLL